MPPLLWRWIADRPLDIKAGNAICCLECLAGFGIEKDLISAIFSLPSSVLQPIHSCLSVTTICSVSVMTQGILCLLFLRSSPAATLNHSGYGSKFTFLGAFPHMPTEGIPSNFSCILSTISLYLSFGSFSDLHENKVVRKSGIQSPVDSAGSILALHTHTQSRVPNISWRSRWNWKLAYYCTRHHKIWKLLTFSIHNPPRKYLEQRKPKTLIVCHQVTLVGKRTIFSYWQANESEHHS